MLLPLAFAEGLGLPRGQIWTALSTALADVSCTEEDISWVLTRARAYIAEVVEDNRSVYRLYHQALAEHMRATAGRPVEQIQALIVDAMIAVVPVNAERQAPDWFSAAPYTRNYLATHARAAGRLARLIQDPGFLLASGQLALLSALPSITDDEGRRIRTAYEQVAHRLSAAYPLSGRAADLQLSARRCGADALAEQVGDLGVPLPWLARWAWWSKTGAHRQLSGHRRSVECVAVATLEGHPIAITGSEDGTARVWDMITQQQIGADLQIEVTVSSVTVGELDDYTVALTGGVDGAVRVWDLSTGLEHGDPLTGHTSRINAIAFRDFAGLPVVLTASGDGTARIWDLRNRVQVGSALAAHRRSVRAAALAELNGKPIGITGGDDKRLYIWDLADVLEGGQAREAGRPLIGFAGAVSAVALGHLADRLVAVAGDETGMLSLWDVAERQQVGEPVVAHKYHRLTRVCSVAIGELGSSQVVLSSGAFDARLWDLGGLRQLGRPLRGHVDVITAAALSGDGEAPMAVTVSQDQTARIWDLTADQPATGHVQGVRAIAFAEIGGRPFSLTGGSDGTARLWDLRTRSEVGVPMEGHAGDVLAVAIGSADGQPFAVTGGSDATIRFWDPLRGTQAGRPVDEHTNAVRCVELAELNGRTVVVTASEDGTIRLWDAASRERVGQPLAGHIGIIAYLAVLSAEAGLEIAAVTSLKHAYLWRVGPSPEATMKAHLSSDAFAASWRIAGVTFDHGQPIALVSNSDNSLQAYNIRTGELVAQPMIGHKDTIWHAAASPRGNETAIATVGYDGIRLWILGTSHPVGEPILGDLNSLSSFTFAQVDGSPVGLVAFRREFRIWDLTTLQPVHEPLCGNSDRITGVSIAPTRSGQAVITGGDDGSLRAHSLGTGQQVAAHLTSGEPIFASAAMSTDSGIIVAACNYRETNVWNQTRRTLIGAIRNYSGTAICLAICQLQSGIAIVIGTSSAEVHAWDLETWAPICAPMLGHTAAVRNVCARVIDGKPTVASASLDGTVRFWDIETGQETAEPLGGYNRGANAVDIGKFRGGLAALTGAVDGHITMWDLESRQSPGIYFEQHPDRIAAIRLQDLADQPFAISADSNGLVRAWDLTAERLHAEVQIGSGINDIAANSDGDLCVATNMGLVALRLNLVTSSASGRPARRAV